MNTNLLISLLIMLTIISVGPSFGQRLIHSSGCANVQIENTMTENEAREKARELAIINAIENAFGTYVEQETDLTIYNGHDYFSIVGATKVRGEWVETLKESYKEEIRTTINQPGNQVENWIICDITGKVRKSTNLKAAINYETLNSPDVRSRTRDYFSGESLYLYFRSPVDGH